VAHSLEVRFVKGARLGESVELGRPARVTFGRASRCDVRLPDALASKTHFVLEERKGVYFLVDKQSTNGTLLNGAPAVEERVYHEDVITVGATKILFLCEDQKNLGSTVHFLASDDPDTGEAPRPKRTDEMIRDLVSVEPGASGLESVFLHLLYDLTNLISGEVDPKALSNRTLEKVARNLDMHRGVIVDGTLRPLAVFSLRGPWSGILKPPLSDLIEEAVRKGISARRNVPFEPGEEDPDATRRPLGAQVMALCAPLRGPEGPVGAIYVDRVAEPASPFRGGALTDEHLSVLVLAGRHIGLALDRARLLREKFLSEERYRILVEKANDCIFLLDREGRFEFVNSRAEPVLGREGADLLGTPLLDLVPPELRAGFQKRLDEALGEGKAQTFETEVTRAGRLRASLSFSLASVEDESGGRAGLLGIVRDVTEGFSEMLSRDPKLAEGVRKRMRMIFNEGERARDIVKNLLDFAQPPRAGHGDVDVNDVVNRAVKLVGHALKQNRIETLSTLDELPKIKGDESQLLQVFLTVITNAVQAIGATGNPGRIVIRSWRIEKEIHVAVTDNGPGIPKENLKRIFDPFFTTKEVGKGTGLGLPICYRIVAARGGAINIDSSGEEGTTVEITLPAPPARRKPPR
jgi:PAS domain S-box-containing protein